MSAYSVLTQDLTPALEQRLAALAGNHGAHAVIVTESGGVTTFTTAGPRKPYLTRTKAPVYPVK